MELTDKHQGNGEHGHAKAQRRKGWNIKREWFSWWAWRLGVIMQQKSISLSTWRRCVFA
jgi:hypothetical protein